MLQEVEREIKRRPATRRANWPSKLKRWNVLTARLKETCNPFKSSGRSAPCEVQIIKDIPTHGAGRRHDEQVNERISDAGGDDRRCQRWHLRDGRSIDAQSHPEQHHGKAVPGAISWNSLTG